MVRMIIILCLFGYAVAATPLAGAEIKRRTIVWALNEDRKSNFGYSSEDRQQLALALPPLPTGKGE